MADLTLSNLPKTWLIDVDGTLVKHNGHLNGGDQLLPGVKDFFAKISITDKVILLTAREKKYESELRKFLEREQIRHDQIIFDLPIGERIVINDKKPSGLKTAHSVNLERDGGIFLNIDFDEKL